MEREESDQSPEDDPAGNKPDDYGHGEDREGAKKNAGAEGAEEGDKQATGNPANAGQE